MTQSEALHEISIKAHQYTDDIKMIISKDCYKELINSLEKQIPKKILDKTLEFDGYYGLCPCCNKVVGESKDFNRCWYCGQALDWSDTE